VAYRPIDSLIPYARNARTHSAAQVEQLVASMREFGWTNPMLVAEDGTVITGHARLRAAIALGLPNAPVIVAKGWTEAQRRAYTLADNKLASNAGWDEALLALELGDLKAMGTDLGLMGFADSELAAFFTSTTPAVDDMDVVPDSQPNPVTRAGDIWCLGSHRILCGDSRDPGQVRKLLNGQRVNVAFTSPPYAEQREYDAASGFRPIPPDDYVEWFASVAAHVAEHLAADGSWFVNIKPSCDGLDTFLYVFDLVIAHARRWGWHFATEFCWERNGMPKSVTQRFKNQFEPVYQFTRGRWKMRPDAVRHASDSVPVAGGAGVGDTSWGEAQGGNGVMFGARKHAHGVSGGKMDDVQGPNWQPGEYIGAGLAYPGNRLPTFTSSHDALGHAAAFPVGLPAFFINAFSDAGDVIYDPFLGSGSTVMAAERTARTGCGIELSPAYVDVCVERWQNFTGKQATLERTGEPFTRAARAAV
jgi:DNA modification methylase